MALDFSKLQHLAQLAKAAQGKQTDPRDALEGEFLAFSKVAGRRRLIVREPTFYAIKGDEIAHAKDAFDALRQKSGKPMTDAPFAIADTPTAVGVTGNASITDPLDAIVSFSLEQATSAGYVSLITAHLTPLVREIYTKGAEMVRDFTIHEALCGEVHYTRGADLALDDVAKFPERFTPGPYSMWTVMDTPHASVKKLIGLRNIVSDYRGLADSGKKDPRNLLLSSKKMKFITEKTIDLQSRLGTLSNYQQPASQRFDALTNSVVVRSNGSDHFYLFEPNARRNVLVHFGHSPFNAASQIPSCLTVLDGNDAQQTLPQLLKLGFFEPGRRVVEQRLADLRSVYDQAINASDATFKQDHTLFEGLIQDLDIAHQYFIRVTNTDARVGYALSRPSQYLEFMIRPSTDDPVLERLLPRLSHNATLRQYHDTRGFAKSFSAATDEERISMIGAIGEHTLFSNRQNNDVNRWLYANHRSLCENAGITFDVIQDR